METIQASDLRKNLFSTLEKVSAGDVVIIKLHGKPVARLVPEYDNGWQKQMKNKIKILCSEEELIAPENIWEEYV